MKHMSTQKSVKKNKLTLFEGVAVDKGSKVETTQTCTHRSTNANTAMHPFNKVVRKRNEAI